MDTLAQRAPPGVIVEGATIEIQVVTETKPTNEEVLPPQEAVLAFYRSGGGGVRRSFCSVENPLHPPR